MYNIMSNECCKEFSGWFRSFTKIERALAILEALLLMVFVVLLILLILHLIVCAKPDDADADAIKHSTTPADTGLGEGKTTINTTYPNTATDATSVNGIAQNEINIDSGIKCSWTPSAKTTAAVHYYEGGASETIITSMKSTVNESIDVFVSLSPLGERDVTAMVASAKVQLETNPTTTEIFDYSDESLLSDHSDGEEAEDEYKKHILALVKLKPPKDVIFGCILTIVTEYWTLTAASCIEAIEEVDFLDSFVIMEQYGSDKRGPLQTVEDVQIHPLYEGKNQSYDLAALRSAGSLNIGLGQAVRLASMLDLALTTIGERLTILGYGAFRSIDKSPSGRSLRKAAVHLLPTRQCATATGGGAALRHLVAGGAAPCAWCGGGGGAVCAAPLWARGLPCNYCSGAPLLLGAALLGVMADNRACGVACEPQLYAAVPPAAAWIRATVRRE